jgi:transposase
MHLVRHNSAVELRRLIRSETHAKVVRRLQAVLGVLEGQSLSTLAVQVQLSERSIYVWVGRYNAQGVRGLRDLPGRGRRKALKPEQEDQLKARLRTGATAADGVCTLRGEDVRHILAEEFGVVRGLQATYDLLHSLGFSVLRPRPRHPKADPVAQGAFKKKRRRSSPTSRPSTRGKPSKSGSKTNAASGRKAR